MSMYEAPLEAKLDEILSMLRILDTKIKFIDDDVQEMRNVELAHIKACVEQLAAKDLKNIQAESAKTWKVERM